MNENDVCRFCKHRRLWHGGTIGCEATPTCGCVAFVWHDPPPTPLYSGPRCTSCGGDHFPQEPTRAHRNRAEVKLVSDAVAGSPVLHRFINRIVSHVQMHKDVEGCETCFAWVEYHYGLTESGDIPQHALKNRG